MTAGPYVIEITLTVRSGMQPGVGQTELMLHLVGAALPHFSPAGRASGFESRDNAPQAFGFTFDSNVAARLIEQARGCGLPNRAPRVEGEVDTSDVFTDIRLDVGLDAQHASMHTFLMASGMVGEDVGQLRSFMTALAELHPSLGSLPQICGRK